MVERHPTLADRPDDRLELAAARRVPVAAAVLAVLAAGSAVLAGSAVPAPASGSPTAPSGGAGAGGDVLLAAGVPAGIALALGVVALLTARRPLPTRLAQPVVIVATQLAALAAIAGLVLTDGPWLSAYVVLAVVVAGAVLTCPRWLAVTAAGVGLLWIAAATVAGGWTLAAAGLPAVAVAGLLSGLLVAERRRAVLGLARARDEAAAVAVGDRLTGAANRRGLEMLGRQIVETARRQGDAVHCAYVDVVGLRAVNDQLGHAAGDEVIVAVAEALRDTVRATDVVARTGGGEFCVLGPGTGMAPTELERRVRARLLVHPPVRARQWNPAVSAGAAVLAPWDAGTLETLVDAAGREMRVRRAVRRGVAGSPESAPADRPDGHPGAPLG